MALRRLLERPRYRVRQFFRGWRAHLDPDEVAEARARLSPAEFALFRAADQHDRRHSFDLMRLLQRDGAARDTPPSEALQVAALVHDVGKGRLLAFHRTFFVVLNAVSPSLARRLEAEHGAPWRRALWRLRHHARLGADMLRVAGSSARVVEIVESHTRLPAEAPDPEVAWFIACDDRV